MTEVVSEEEALRIANEATIAFIRENTHDASVTQELAVRNNVRTTIRIAKEVAQ